MFKIKIFNFKKQKKVKKMSNITQEYLDELLAKRETITSTRSYLQHQVGLATNSPGTRNNYAHRLQMYIQAKDTEFRTLDEEIEALDFYLKQNAVDNKNQS